MEKFGQPKEEAPVLSDKMKITSMKKLKEAGESILHEAHIQSASGKDQKIALKEVKNIDYATPEEMESNKIFYWSLREFKKFRKFIPPTAYIKGRMDAESDSQTFRLQRFIEGKSIDKFSDNELYKNPEVVRQLEEFAEAAIEVLEKTRKEKTLPPDFMRTPELAGIRVLIGSMMVNPRYSSNIFIADEPDKNGQKVFYVDTSANADVSHKKTWKFLAQYLHSPLQIRQLGKWKEKLQKILEEK